MDIASHWTSTHSRMVEGALFILITMHQRTIVIIPSYNEAHNIVDLVTRILKLHPEMHVLVVDDNSPDGTAELLGNAQKKLGQNLQIMVRTKKGGRGSAVMEGFHKAIAGNYQYIFEMDADFSHKPEELHLFLDAIQHNDMVIGSRYLPGSEIHEWGMKRTLFSAFANYYARWILKIPISDYTNGFRCYTNKALRMLDMDSIDAKGYVVLSEVAYQLYRKGLRIGEVPTIFINRRRGESNLGLHEIHEAFFSVLRIRSKSMYVHATQVVKFIISGICGTFIDLGILMALVRATDMSPDLAFVPSTLVAATFVFLFNKFITFGRHEHSALTQVWRFAIIYIAAILLNIGIAMGLHRLGIHYVLAKALAIGIVAIWNYILSHSFIFAATADTEPL
jgi:dolichol-phosphate mannosyltransferase